MAGIEQAEEADGAAEAEALEEDNPEEYPPEEADEAEAEAEADGEEAGFNADEALGGAEEPAQEAEPGGLAEPDEPAEPMLELGLDGKYTVRMRQRLRTTALAEQFCTQLIDKVDEEKSLGKTVVFEDFDISQNVIPSDQLEGIFAALADGGVHVERFRAFGCPTLNDQAATFLSGWLSGVTQETVPYELHLSDCAITSDGFHSLAKALEENEAFPGPDPRNPSRLLPLYIRLEHNYIEESVIQAAIDEGTIVTMRKNEGVRHSNSAKARLLVREDGAFQQKKGEPPAPEDAPPPKRVYDKGKGKDADKGKGKGKGKTTGKAHERDRDRRLQAARDRVDRVRERLPDRFQDYDRSRDRVREVGKGTGKSRAADAKQRLPPWAALPAPRPTQSTRTPAQRPSFGKGERRQLEVERPAPLKRYEPASGKGSGKGTAKGAKSSGPYNAFARGGSNDSSQRGSGNSTGDRFGDGKGVIGAVGRPAPRRQADFSREEAPKRQRTGTPSSKGSGPRAGGDSGPPRAFGSSRQRPSGLPAPWEEHWSDEYRLTYFWNAKTGESAWERPGS